MGGLEMVSAKCSDPGALGLDTGLLGSAQFCGLQMKPEVATDHRAFYHYKPSHPQGFSGSNPDWPWSSRAPPPQADDPLQSGGPAPRLVAWAAEDFYPPAVAVSALGARYSACSLFPHSPTHSVLILAPPPKAAVRPGARAHWCIS